MEVEFNFFADSIADTISFFDPAFDFGRMEAVHEDIAAMPMGYHGLIGDKGALWRRQKQRVILARGLYRQAKLLFLHEVTRHLNAKCDCLGK
ncbi:hypothetical protein XACN24_03420 [Xanthomonas albilineans]|nr:hypothetical protein [Xanthomonas albilineans]QHQ27470.1 hypothetical protein XaFJ1_GM000718 [Xanthomonas albilineans]